MAGVAQIRSHIALRGAAALLVVLYHLQYGAMPHLGWEDATAFFRRSYLMVDLFFILSGFIIPYVNRGDRTGRFGWTEYRDFTVRRLIRLYPLLIATLAYMLLFALALALGGGPSKRLSPEGLAVLATQAAMINAWTPWPPGWNVPSWSISAEIAAYLLFPLVVGLHAARPRVAALLLGLTAAGFYAYVAARGGSLDIIVFPAPFRCLAGFALGMLIFYARASFAALPDRRLSLLQLGAVAAALACLLWPVADVAAIPPFALIVATTITDRGILARAIGRRPLLQLGEISYSVYLTHVPVIQTLGVPWSRLARHLGPDLGRALWLLLCLAGVIAVSNLTYRWIELPARRILTPKLLGHRARPAAVAVPAP